MYQTTTANVFVENVISGWDYVLMQYYLITTAMVEFVVHKLTLVKIQQFQSIKYFLKRIKVPQHSVQGPLGAKHSKKKRTHNNI